MKEDGYFRRWWGQRWLRGPIPQGVNSALCPLPLTECLTDPQDTFLPCPAPFPGFLTVVCALDSHGEPAENAVS